MLLLLLVYTLLKNICSNLSKDINTPNRGVKISKNFSVLRKTKMLALFIEIDFISNSYVEVSLKDGKYIIYIVDSIFKFLLGFLCKSMVKEDKFYKVCIGEFTDIVDDTKLIDTAISKVFSNTYIIS